MLTSKKENGGLNLSNILIRDLSLKVQWVQRYCQDSTIQALADRILQNKIGDQEEFSLVRGFGLMFSRLSVVSIINWF